ncbi:unnamed protein product [Spirodela intermedia]|uniref:Uncharacterized protein n=1 Tax=Spirodela intermedia TaxID=51605 RepID=A0A7I8LFZ8_SPIIN|nr:unnamed protein product [Spirodela intermedia]
MACKNGFVFFIAFLLALSSAHTCWASRRLLDTPAAPPIPVPFIPSFPLPLPLPLPPLPGIPKVALPPFPAGVPGIPTIAAAAPPPPPATGGDP